MLNINKIKNPITAIHEFKSYATYLKGKKGLEIGGPSIDFFPLDVYSVPESVDNINFSEVTLWNRQQNNTPYIFQGKQCPGQVYICDGVDLKGVIKDEEYDFVFASHTLEHIVNPLRALKEWNRVLKRDGLILLVLPWKIGTFDHKRPISKMSQLVDFYNSGRGEDYVMDLLPEILETYDLSRDGGAGTREQFIERCKYQNQNRALHVHVFDFDLLDECLEFIGFKVLDKQLVFPYHQIVLAKKCN